MREKVQQDLDLYFIPQNIPVEHIRYKGTSNQYITFEIRENRGQFADDEKIISETNVIVRYFDDNRNNLDKMSKEIQNALKDYECIDEGSDIISLNSNQEIFGIELEFIYYGY